MTRGRQWRLTSPAAIAAGTLSAGVFLVFHYVLVFPRHLFFGEFIFALALAALSYPGFFLVIPRKMTLSDRLTEIAPQIGMAPEEMAALMEESRDKIADLRRVNIELDGEAHDRVERIADWADRIIAGFTDDPEDVHRSWNFLHHYLDATVEVVRQYRELKRKRAGERVRDVLDKVEETLAEIEDVFSRQYQRNLDNEALSLDVDIDVLRRMMRSEGL